MEPPARLCLLENVPGLKDVDKNTGRSNYDSVKGGFESIGYAFVSMQFDASDTGLPNRRPRLYMAAIAGLTAAQKAGLDTRVSSSMGAMLRRVIHRPLDDFLLDKFVPADAIADWMPELQRPRVQRTATKGLPDLAACPHAADEPRYLAHLCDNPWFQWLSVRERRVLLWHLCHHAFPGPGEGCVLLHNSVKFTRLVPGSQLPTQVPNAVVWLLGRNRLMTGAEALMLQGVDLGAIRGFSMDSAPSRFLQDLAGNAFCVNQFLLMFLASLPEATQRAN